MALRVSQKNRAALAEVLDVDSTEPFPRHTVNCHKEARRGDGARRLIYRRLTGTEAFGEAWPESTDILCWHCGLHFNTTPVPAVQDYDEETDKYDVYGIFCTLGCVKRHISDSACSTEVSRRLVLQRQMAIAVFGWPADQPITQAPPKVVLQPYGGYMSVEEFRTQHPGIRIELRSAPFVPHVIFAETENTTDDFRLTQPGDDDLSTVAARTAAINGSSTMDPLAEANSLEQTSIHHGGTVSLKDMRRPPEDQVLRTPEDLQQRYPKTETLADRTDSAFETFMHTQPLPSDAECRVIRDQQKMARKEEREARKMSKQSTTVTTPPPLLRGVSGDKTTSSSAPSAKKGKETGTTKLAGSVVAQKKKKKFSSHAQHEQNGGLSPE
jgi:hypothetical protein